MAYSGNPTAARFRTDMLNFAKQLKGSLEENYIRQAEELMGNMRQSVPVVEGNLKRSIRRKNITQKFGAAQRVAVLVMAGGPLTTRRTKSGHSYDYALSVEFGDIDEPARPFFYSNARRYEQAGRQSAAETLEKAIEENNRLRAQRAENTNFGNRIQARTGAGGAVVIRGRI